MSIEIKVSTHSAQPPEATCCVEIVFLQPQPGRSNSDSRHVKRGFFAQPLGPKYEGQCPKILRPQSARVATTASKTERWLLNLRPGPVRLGPHSLLPVAHGRTPATHSLPRRHSARASRRGGRTRNFSRRRSA